MTEPSYTSGYGNPVVRWKFVDVWGAASETEHERLSRLVREVRSGATTLNQIRAEVDEEAYGNTEEHFEPLPVDPAQDAPHMATDTLLYERIRAIFNNRGVTIAYSGVAPSYVWEINPNQGGSPQVSKNMNIVYNVGPNRGGIIQEGQSTAPILSFSGVLITQSHYEALETWFDKRVLIELTDDLGRTFRGVFSAFSPERVRKPYNPWYHTYQAQFTVFGYKNASGQIRYGRF